MRLQLSIFALLVLFTAAPASAQTTYTWTGGNGPWNDPSRWSPAGVPAAGDEVHISSGTVTLPGNTTVAGLHLSNTGIITGNADLTITGSMVWSAAGAGIESLGGTGTVTVAPGATLSMTGTNSNFRSGPNRTFVNAGTAVWNGRGEWGGQGQFINEGDLELAYDAETPTRFCFSSTTDAVVNAASGTIRRTGAGELVVYCPFANHGLIEVHTGTLRMRDFNGNGGTDSGAYAVSEGAVLLFDGRRTLTGTASVTGEGTVRTGGNSSQTVAINGTLSVPVLDLVGAVRLDVNTDAAVDTLILGVHESLSSGQIGGSGTLTVARELRWMNGTMGGSGTIVVAEGATLSIDARTNYIGLGGSRHLINEGTTTWTSSGSHHLSNHSDAVFENRGTVTVTATNDGAFSDFFAGTFVNAEGGVLRRTGAGQTRFGSGFENHGTVEILEGELELKGFNATGGTDSGAYVLADSTRLELTGGHRTLTETAEVAGTGTVVASGPLTNGGTWRPGASPGTLTIESDYPAEEGVLEVELAGHAPGAEHDRLVVTGEARLGGTLRVVLLDDFVPQTGDRFTVLTAEEVTGAFAAVEAPEGVEVTVETTDSTAVLVIGQVTVANEDEPDAGAPAAFALHAPYPNPTSGRAALAFDLPEAAPVRLSVFDVLGREVAVLVEEERAAGRYEAALDGRGLAAGLYLVRLHAGPFVATRRLTVMR